MGFEALGWGMEKARREARIYSTSGGHAGPLSQGLLSIQFILNGIHHGAQQSAIAHNSEQH